MANEQAFTLFGQPTPDEIRQSIGRANLQDAMAFANMRPGRGIVAVGAQQGGMLGAGLAQYAGATDPRVEKAKQVQSAMDEIKNLDQSDPVGFLHNSAEIFNKNGLTDLGWQASSQASAIKIQSQLANAKELTARAAWIRANKDTAAGASNIEKMYTAWQQAKNNKDTIGTKIYWDAIQKAINPTQLSPTTIVSQLVAKENTRRAAEAFKNHTKPTVVKGFTDLSPGDQALINIIQKVYGVNSLFRGLFDNVNAGPSTNTNTPAPSNQQWGIAPASSQ